ncbi:MAG: hypothetical protein J5741_07460 [Bacteroidales bacterium]|nr:hypothetical protein [Bacteroidales bacterium]
MKRDDTHNSHATSFTVVNALSENDYDLLLKQIFADIKSTRISLARRMNSSIIQLYWNIGRQLSERKIDEGYGSAIINRLSADLKKEFPQMGFSPRNLWNMKQFYDTFSASDQKLQQLVAVLPWGHNVLLMNKLSSQEEMFYEAMPLSVWRNTSSTFPNKK